MNQSRALLIAVLLALPAWSEEPFMPGTAARTLAATAMLGFTMGMEDNLAGATNAPQVLACVHALDTDPVSRRFQTLLAADLNAGELADLDRFFSSPTGQKYELTGRLEIYKARGTPAPEPQPQFTAAEYSELEKFSNTSVGQKYIYGRWVQKADVQAALQEELKRMYRACINRR